jgi:hypothetical protein|tara:strand:- start:5146 stop:6516 length:1371 start_codon:yes stop_codon:yes gene_type:complete
MSVTKTFTVTVVSTDSGNKYFIDGVQQATINIAEGGTYKFDQSDSSNSSHPLRFSTTSNGTHSGGSEYTTGVTTNGTPGSSGAYTQITVAASAPTLYYYCQYHSGMGGQANTPAGDSWGVLTWNQNSWGQQDKIEFSLTGVSATSSVGSTLEAFNESGWGRLRWGDADWNEGANETISVGGLGLTSSVGSLTLESKYLLEMIGSNHSLTSSIGSLQVNGEIGVPLTGVSAEFATPTLSYTGTLVGWGRDGWNDNSWGESPDQVIPLVGQELTSSVGSPTLGFAYELSGQEATTSVDDVSFVISPTVALSGQSSTLSLGTLGLSFGAVDITGVSSTSSVGTLGLEFGPSDITGVSATFNVGQTSISSVEIITLSGVSSTSSVGSPTLEFAYELSGQSSTSSVGSITLSDVVQGLVTDELTSTVGLLGVQAYANIDTGSNTSYTGVATGSNTSYTNVA